MSFIYCVARLIRAAISRRIVTITTVNNRNKSILPSEVYLQKPDYPGISREVQYDVISECVRVFCCFLRESNLKNVFDHV